MKQILSFLVLLLSLICSTTVMAKEWNADKPILFLGSSTIELWGQRLGVDFPGLNIINLGAGGSKFYYLLENAEKWIQLHPNTDRIVIYSGDNDIADGDSADKVLSNASELIDIFHKKLPQAQLYLISVKICPDRMRFVSTVRKVNEDFKALEHERPYLTYVDTASTLLDGSGLPIRDYFRADGVHLTDGGYEEWAKVLFPVLRDSLNY